ncbi:MAG: B12-binding domain-containing radical SAM protein, partial [Desulfobacterales bacterium]|nr:B12-binding domain-containing radical SAM protein [Desulfobacterales bacterium]
EMNKHFKSQDVRHAATMLSDYGIHTMGFLMLGGPGENKDSVEESLEFVDALNLNALKITLGIRIYPYTKLAKIAFGEGVIAEDDDLLFPRFYMAKGLEDWLRETVEDRIRERPNWII